MKVSFPVYPMSLLTARIRFPARSRTLLAFSSTSSHSQSSNWNDSYEKNKANIATKAMQQRMLILRLCHAALSRHIRSLSSIERLHNTFLQHFSYPGRTTITSSFLQVISKDSYFWEYIQHAMAIFAGALESLLEACHLTGDLPNVQEFRELLIEIRGNCREAYQRSNSISNA
jgi:hypothetical protein